ncbi:MobP2 family relaxase [Listeria booriae]|uniref:MobP2 family relaxase n=1 Tax=Listeria booriae TaxID=1552123 RepID=UPI001E38356A|nr:MobP2 family relaxase [Listeria booriae]MCD2208581.1 relaxase MobL [Listeria booriae]
MSADLGVLHDTKFTYGGKDIVGFIQYMADEMKTNQQVADMNFAGFLGYMDNPTKSAGLFDASCKYISQAERSNYVQLFKLGQERHSVFWQDLFSFNNEWLAEYGLMDLKTNEVDDTRLMNAVKSAMDVLIKREGLQDYKWLGSMHHNTDNRHFHVSGVELTPSREWKWHAVFKKDYRGRYLYDEKGWKIPTGEKVFEPTGKRRKETLKEMKSVFVNQLIQSASVLKEIDIVARKEIIDGIKKQHIIDGGDMAQRQLVAELYLKLPKDKRLWNMKNANKQFFGNEVRAVVLQRIQTDLADPYKRWERQMEDLGKTYEKAYKKVEVEGAPTSDPDIQKFVKDDGEGGLHYRLGNAVLSQIRELDKERQKSGLNRRAYIETVMTQPIQDKERAIKEVQSYIEEESQAFNFMDHDAPPEIDDMFGGFSEELERESLTFDDNWPVVSSDNFIPDPRHIQGTENGEKPPSQKGQADPETGQGLVFTPKVDEDAERQMRLSQKGQNGAPPSQKDIDFGLSALIFTPSKEVAPEQEQKKQNPLSQKGPTESGPTQDEIDTGLSTLIYTPKEDYAREKQNRPSQKGTGPTKPAFHMVNVYTENGKLRVLTSSDATRLDAQIHHDYGSKQTNKGDNTVMTMQPFLEERRRQRNVDRTLRGIDRNMKKASKKWQDEMEYERLEQQLLHSNSSLH